MIRIYNGPQFIGRAMLGWAYRQGISLRLIEPGKPNQNAYVESFNGRSRHESLNEHCSVVLLLSTWSLILEQVGRRDSVELNFYPIIILIGTGLDVDCGDHMTAVRGPPKVTDHMRVISCKFFGR